METVKSAIRIFKLLMINGEINRKEHFDLFNEYIDVDVQEILGIFEDEFSCKILYFDNIIYLVPEIDGFLLGAKPSEFRAYFASNATQKDVFLAFYIMMYILYEFFSGSNINPKKIDFLQINHLITKLDERFERLDKLDEKQVADLEEEFEINIRSNIEIWNALFTDHETKRKTKFNIIKNACRILEEHNLLYIVENQIRTSSKLDTLMQQYYLHSDRVKVINNAFEKGVL